MKIEILERETIFVRDFAAPRALVFRAWTDPRMLAEWWGPKGFTNPECTADARPGGRYRIVMRSPEGEDFPCEGSYHEIIPNEKVVMTDEFGDGMPEAMIRHLNELRGLPADAPPPVMLVTVLFEDIDGGTRVTIRSRYETDADRDAVMGLGAAEGWQQSFDKLEALL